jgi:hypothetical protein
MISWQGKSNFDKVIKDFGNTFDYKRFSKTVQVINNNYEKRNCDSIIIESFSSKKKAWKNINSVFGVCDYIVQKDSLSSNSFFIWSNKAARKFWVKYNNDNKIKIIKTITPKLTLHLIPPPCGY